MSRDSSINSGDLDTMLLRLVESSVDPDDFLQRLEEICRPDVLRGDAFADAGNRLFRMSKVQLALAAWERARVHYIRSGYAGQAAACELSAGLAYSSLGDSRRQIEHAQRALTFAASTGDRSFAATCYNHLAGAYTSVNDAARARECLDRALELARASGNKQEEVAYHTNSGYLGYRSGDFRSAAVHWEQGLRLATEYGDADGLRRNLTNLGEALRSTGDYGGAIAYLERALDLFVAAGDRISEMMCLLNLGAAFLSRGDYRAGKAHIEKALGLSRVSGDRLLEGKSLANLGGACLAMGDFVEAMRCCEQALPLLRELGDPGMETTCWVTAGQSLLRQGDTNRARQYFLRALELAQAAGDVGNQIACYGNMAELCRDACDFVGALTYSTRVRDMSRAIGHKSSEGGALLDMAIVYVAQGDFKLAIEHQERALGLALEAQDRGSEASCYGNLGEVYRRLGDLPTAREQLQKALALTTDLGYRLGETRNCITLGAICADMHDFELAWQYNERARAVAAQIGAAAEEAAACMNLGAVWAKKRDGAKAIELLQQALAVARSTPDAALTALCTMNLGAEVHNAGDARRALGLYRDALAVFERLGDLYHAKACRLNLGNACISLGDLRRAIEWYEQAVDALEQLRREKIPKDSQRGFWRENVVLFDNLVTADVGVRDFSRAVEDSERGKGRVIRDMMLRPGIEQPPWLRLDDMQAVADRLNRSVVSFRATQQGTHAFILRPRAGLDYVALPKFNASRLEQLAIGNGRAGWLAGYHRYCQASSHASRMAVEGHVAEAGRLHKEEQQKWFDLMLSTLSSLSEELLEPVFSRFNPGDRVVLMPNRALNTLPLHAGLRGQGASKRYLIDDFEISYAPNFGLLRQSLEQEATVTDRESLFVIADTLSGSQYRLPFAEWEAEEIARLFQKYELHVKQPASMELLSRAEGFGVVHLAMHGVCDVNSPLDSRLLLGDGVELRLRDIIDKVRLRRSWLVCLSACESGLTDSRDIADEFIGLPAGFMHGGVPTVIASLWTVRDDPTALLMIKTYEGIFREQLSKSAALRKAQCWLKSLTARELSVTFREKELALCHATRLAREDISPLRREMTNLRDPQSHPYDHPYYWAGFQVFGI